MDVHWIPSGILMEKALQIVVSSHPMIVMSIECIRTNYFLEALSYRIR